MYKWKPSKKKKKDFAEKMHEIDLFCNENGITQSRSSDSYYFALNGKKYRVSNHTIEKSNANAYNADGEKVRDFYHDQTRNDDIIYIHASKLRIIEIYENLKNGYKLDGNGYIKN